MPVYPERESALLSRLHSKGAASQDKRTWVIGGKDENKEREAERFKNFRKGSSTVNTDSPAASTPTQPQPQPSLPVPQRTGTIDTMMGASSSGATEDIMSSLAGLDLTGSTPQEQPLLPTPAVQSPTAYESSNGLDSALFAQVNPASTAPLTLGSNIEKVSHCARTALISSGSNASHTRPRVYSTRMASCKSASRLSITARLVALRSFLVTRLPSLSPHSMLLSTTRNPTH